MLDISYLDNVPVLRLNGRFEAFTAPPVRSWLQANQQVDALVVDLSGVTFMDSTALAMLVQGLKNCRSCQGDLHLTGLQPAVKLIIELTRLDKVFKIFPDVATAVAAFAKTSVSTSPKGNL